MGILRQLSGQLFNVSVCSIIGCGTVAAQSTPSEFAELSFQALLDTEIDDGLSGKSSMRRWSVAVQFKAVEFDGYRQNETDLPLKAVLYTGGDTPRTNRNFPIVPTVINQYAQIVQLGYQYADNVKLALQLPLIKQTTDHISTVPGYNEFEIASQGMGDMVITAGYMLNDSASARVWLNAGVSLPTGSIDEAGDTPRAPGDQQLPYTMQLGSGTYDFPLELSYQTKGQHSIALALSAMLRTGANDRHYRLGNNYELSAKYSYRASPRITVFGGAELSHADAIHGQDNDIVLDAPFPYPASITNPALYGGQKITVMAGLTYKALDWLNISLDGGKPLYQNLNGPQPKEVWRTSLQLSASF